MRSYEVSISLVFLFVGSVLLFLVGFRFYAFFKGFVMFHSVISVSSFDARSNVTCSFSLLVNIVALERYFHSYVKYHIPIPISTTLEASQKNVLRSHLKMFVGVLFSFFLLMLFYHFRLSYILPMFSPFLWSSVASVLISRFPSVSKLPIQYSFTCSYKFFFVFLKLYVIFVQSFFSLFSNKSHVDESCRCSTSFIFSHVEHFSYSSEVAF